MKRLLLAATAAAALLPGIVGAPAHADSYCISAGLVIFGEPYLAHMQCVSCPVQDCPDLPAAPAAAHR